MEKETFFAVCDQEAAWDPFFARSFDMVTTIGPGFIPDPLPPGWVRLGRQLFMALSERNLN